MLPRLFALDCFTMIRMPFYQMGHQYTVVHGIGPENTGAHYVRGNFKTRPDDLDIWKSLGYLWTDVVSSDDVVPVLRFCRDTLTLPDHIHLLEEEYNAVMIKDSKITNDRPRWLEIFQFIYGDTTHQDDDFFRLAVISPGCSSLTMENCTTKDIIKLAQMGLVVVDGKYNCFVEKPAPEDEHLPLYTFNNEVRVEDVVDSGIQTTLVSDH